MPAVFHRYLIGISSVSHRYFIFHLRSKPIIGPRSALFFAWSERFFLQHKLISGPRPVPKSGPRFRFHFLAFLNVSIWFEVLKNGATFWSRSVFCMQFPPGLFSHPRTHRFRNAVEVMIFWQFCQNLARSYFPIYSYIFLIFLYMRTPINGRIRNNMSE